MQVQPLSPETRTVTIRTQVDNKDLALKPQMLATMKIQGAMEKTLAIPSLAVVRENDQDQKQRAEQAGSPSHSPITVHRCHPSLPASEDQDLVSRGRCCSERVHPRERRSRKDDA